MEFIGILFWLYIYFYIGLGFVQVIASIVRLFTAKRKDSAYAIGLKRYLVGVFLYFTLLPVLSDGILLFYLMVVPWGIAIWYFLHIRKWNKKRRNIASFDRMYALDAPDPDRLLLESFPTRRILLANDKFKIPTIIPKKQEATIRHI